MTAPDQLISRNRNFAAGFSGSGLSILPRLGAVVITCLDPRVDPAHVFGIELGDAAVVRNLGGRVTPDVLAQLAILRVLIEHEGAEGPMTVFVVHHTDCDTGRPANPELAAETAAGADVDEESIDVLAVGNPAATVAKDVGQLRRALPAGTKITGMVYDVATGAARVTWRSG